MLRKVHIEGPSGAKSAKSQLWAKATLSHHNTLVVVALLSHTSIKYASQVSLQMWMMLSSPCYSCSASACSPPGSCSTGGGLKQTPPDACSLPTCSDLCEPSCYLVSLLTHSFAFRPLCLCKHHGRQWTNWCSQTSLAPVPWLSVR